MSTSELLPAAEPAVRPWQDPTLSVADRVELLLPEMTLEEKVAQLGSRWVGNDMAATASDYRPRTGDRREPTSRRWRTCSPAGARRWRRRAGTASAS